MAHQEFLLDAEVTADPAHFILEELTQRFHQLELHAFRQSAHIVVALDRGRRPAHRDGLDHIGIQRALGEEVEVAERLRFLVEHVDEGGADDLALGLGIGDAGETGEEEVGGVDVMHRQRQLLVALHHLLRLVQPQQPVVHEDALQVIADGAMDDRRRDGGVHAARQPADDAALPHLRLDARRGLVDERRDGPVAGAPAYVEREVAKQVGATVGVGDFRMEEHGVIAAIGRFHDGHWCVGAGGGHGEARRRRGHEVAVTGPDLEFVGNALEQPRRHGRRPANHGVAELAMRGTAERAAEHVGHQLHAVADAEHRDAEVEHGAVTVRRTLLIDTAGTARQNHADRRLGPDRLEGGIERKYFAVHRQLAQTPSDQLGELRAEIQDEDGLMGHEISNER